MALKKHYDQHFEKVYKLVFSLIQDEGDALEVTTDAFLALYNALKRPIEVDVKSFLIITARNFALNFLRAKKKSA